MADFDQSRCAEPECARVVDARGLCHTHYERWRRTGTAAAPVRRIRPVEERFAAKIAEDPASGCHLWTGAKDSDGYGLFRIARNRIVRAHIFAWEMRNGVRPSGTELDHFKCDTPSCCNADHVRPVTPRENSLRSNNACAANMAKTQCKHGHEFTPENTWRTAAGYRLCKTCARDRKAAAK